MLHSTSNGRDNMTHLVSLARASTKPESNAVIYCVLMRLLEHLASVKTFSDVKSSPILVTNVGLLAEEHLIERVVYVLSVNDAKAVISMLCRILKQALDEQGRIFSFLQKAIGDWPVSILLLNLAINALYCRA
jgi:hypothetical protein